MSSRPGFLDFLHAGVIYGRRVERLAHHLSQVIPRDATVLDVGCGDGHVDRALASLRPDLSIEGLDVLVRSVTEIPVRRFDGTVLPAADRSVDVITFVDVLHHTTDPLVLLREAARVARRAIVVKDHLADGPASRRLLRFMDRIGNERHGVVLPYNYWTGAQWSQAFAGLHLLVEEDRRDLRLYTAPIDAIFGRALHFMARLTISADVAAVARAARRAEGTDMLQGSPGKRS